MKRRITLLIAVAALLVFTAGAIAGSSSEKIQAYLAHDFKIVADGQDFVVKDGDATLAPIVYNDRTYLPVRALGEALGVEVDWDEATRTVYLGEKAVVVEPDPVEPDPVEPDPVEPDPVAPVADLAISPTAFDLSKADLQDVQIDLTWGSATAITEMKGTALGGAVDITLRDGKEYTVADNADGTAVLTIKKELAELLPVPIAMVPENTVLTVTIKFDDGQKTFELKVVN
ncbi:MAG TPA: stalk domain-containing protein [Syntrophomonadaceae bacterium]|nr:stalk domain-containing protein [Syntrophomonadaceae bacterium]